MSGAVLARRRPVLEAFARGGRELPVAVRVAVAAAVGLASLALPSAPAYDPWSWLIWGRELAAGELHTAEGPAWKPLPALVAVPLTAVLGEWAPEAWLALARAGAVLAVLEAYALARRLVRGRWGAVAGVAAAVAVLLVAGFVEHAAVGDAEGALAALLLMAVHALLDGRVRSAFWLGAGAALIRVEVWPFLAALGLVLARRDRRARVAVAAAGASLLALWFLPELLASGEVWRSAVRATVANPGAPALQAVPALATLELALAMAPAAVASLGAAGGAAAVAGSLRSYPAVRGALFVGGTGVAWVALVAAMSEAGFSGEGRYLLPGVVLVSAAGAAAPLAVATARSARGPGRRASVAPLAMSVAVAAGLLATSLARVPELATALDRSARTGAVTDDLSRAVASAGGTGRVLRCGPPYTRRFGGPVLAWALRVPKPVIDFHRQRPGVSFRPRRLPGEPPGPPRPPGASTWLVRTAHWEVVGACARRRAGRPGVARRARPTSTNRDAPRASIRVP